MPGLTLTIITHRASSLNYGENIGNVSVLKKLTLGDNKQITYISDKALKYDMKRCGKERFGWKLLDKEIKNHIENSSKNNIIDVDEFCKALVSGYEEFDLFGGLFTKLTNEEKGKEYKLSKGDAIKRTSVVKVSYAFSVSPFKSDMDFMNNIHAYNRYLRHVTNSEQAIALSEQHTSHYIYTVTIDLDRVGAVEVENKVETVLDKEKRIKRVKELLEAIKNLNRQIRGRWENLSPVFVVGGVFSVKNPFFIDSVRAIERDGKLEIDLKMLKDAMDLVPKDEKVLVGISSGYFHDEEELREKLGAMSVGEVFEELKKKVEEIYNESSQV